MQTNLDTTPMDKNAVAAYLGCSVPQIQNLVSRGDIPEGQYIGGRKKYWFKAHLDQYVARMQQKALDSWGRQSKEPPALKTAAPATGKKRGRPPKVRAPIVATSVPPALATITPMRQVQQEACQVTEAKVPFEAAQAGQLSDILGDLSALLKQRKAGR